VTTRVVGALLLVAGIVVTVVGLGARFVWRTDEGHHDGRVPTFAVDSVQGADTLVVQRDGPLLEVSLERAGRTVTHFDAVHGAPAHVFVVGTDLDSFQHVDLAGDDPDGTVEVRVDHDGTDRVVLQTAPAGGPDLLELGATVEVSSTGSARPDGSVAIADETWSDGALTIERQGLDFVLSEPWNGEEHHDGPAFLTMYRAGDLAFAHGHATMPADDLFRFNLDLPGRGEYLAALELVQDGELVTALFRFEL
jgi:hypothetical protein